MTSENIVFILHLGASAIILSRSILQVKVLINYAEAHASLNFFLYKAKSKYDHIMPE